MRNLLLFSVFFIAAFISCNNHPATTYAGTAKALSKRNLSITKANSYSDLFLDSAAVEQFITQQKLNDTIANDLRSFYNVRNFQLAWFAGDGLTEQALAFNNLYSYEADSAKKYLDKKLDEWMMADSIYIASVNADIAKTELMLTWRFINYAWGTYKDAEERAYIMEHAVPAQKMSLPKMTEAILSDKDDKSTNVYYQSMKEQLKKYADSVKADSASSAKDSLLAKMKMIVLNMQRMRWLPEKSKGRLLLVNIPEFRLHAFDGAKKDFDMDIVVGKEGHNTVMFSGDLSQVVFSPYWNIPRSIVRKEIVPAMERNKRYLEEKNMEITGEENGLPVVRQLPGEKNDLGKVKFLFPNSFNIYFHDTPHKELFSKDKRAYSHGCIRLSDPVKMANYILQDQPGWTPSKINEAMNSGKEQYVKVKTPVPVLIYYYTAWVDENGVLQFREDIYGHDKKLAEKLFFSAATQAS